MKKLLLWEGITAAVALVIFYGIFFLYVYDGGSVYNSNAIVDVAAIAVITSFAVGITAVTELSRKKISIGWALISLIVEAIIIFGAMTIPTGLLF